MHSSATTPGTRDSGMPRACNLADFIGEFEGQFLSDGYRMATAKSKARMVSRWLSWLQARRVGIENIDESYVETYISSLGAADTRRLHKTALRQYLSFLREQHVIAYPESPDTDPILIDFRRYMIEERQLSESTMGGYALWVGRFVRENSGSQEVGMEGLRAQDICRFVRRWADRVRPGTAKVAGTALRCFLRFLHLRGDIDRDLTGAVPAVAGWRLSNVPMTMRESEIERWLAGCDRTTATGIRNYALFLLLARLGLRSGELVRLELDDIDWDAGEITVRSKDARVDRLPLLPDVGEALATYLRDARPECNTRRLFVRMRPPIREFSGHTAIRTTVVRSMERAGVVAPHKGPHTLRHSLASRMLNAGVPLGDIGEILRHRNLDTTRIYAKVNIAALRELVLPWPGGVK